LNPADTGGVYVYYVKHGDAKKIADTLNGVAQEAKKAQEQGSASGRGQGTSSRFRPPSFDGGDFNPFDAEGSGSVGAIFGGEVKINSDEDTNSLIITASKQDYQVIERLLAQIDIPREQVFVKVVIMDMDASIDNVYGMNFYKFDENSNGIGRIGFVGEDSVANLVNPANDKGAILGFGSGDIVKLGENAGQAAGLEVTSLAVFIKFLQSSVGANVLSEPQIMALDNQEAEIEVGANVPVGTTNTTAGTGVVSQGIDRQDATIHLKIKPYISPDSDLVKMDIEQKINQVSPTSVAAANLAESAIAITKRTLKTSIVVNDGDTAVLGGLMQDAENETVSKIPVLGDIPILGWLFKYRKVSKQKKNLMLFITPNIMRDLQESNDLLTDKIDERIDFIQRYMNGEDPHGQYIDRLPRKASNSNSLSEELNSPPMESPAPESL
ncbi:MAG: type II secretion system protein GspD, partial [Bdellovibrionales bacterium]|nr:type II secretion system protein GspD [Bdellovibrionales bacterium]